MPVFASPNRRIGKEGEIPWGLKMAPASPGNPGPTYHLRPSDAARFSIRQSGGAPGRMSSLGGDYKAQEAAAFAAARAGINASGAAVGRPPVPNPGGGNSQVPIVSPASRSRARAASIAAQNAGMPAWNWEADENKAVLQAAQSAGEAAAKARASGSALPDTSNPATQAFWDRADNQVWAKANPKLAEALKKKHGFVEGGSRWLPDAKTWEKAGEGQIPFDQALKVGAIPGVPSIQPMDLPPGAFDAPAFDPKTAFNPNLQLQSLSAVDPRAAAQETNRALAAQAATPGAFAPPSGQVAPGPDFQVPPAELSAVGMQPWAVSGDFKPDPSLDASQVFNRDYLEKIKKLGLGR